jgi:peptidoglycan/LPS O-acetylase OafA/YrhL
MNIGAISYSISAFTFLIFLAILLTDRHKGPTKQALVIAASVNCIGSFVLAYESLLLVAEVQLSIFEYFKTVSWLVLLVQLLSVVYSEHFSAETIKKIQYAVITAIVLLIVPALSVYFLNDVFHVGKNEYLTALNLLATIIGIALIEQVYRNTRAEQKWAIKYLCLGLLGMFTYDFYMYADALLYQRIDLIVWEARGFV